MTAPASVSATRIEYLIYTFDFSSESSPGRSPWHRYAALADEDLALAQAQILSDTHKYRRVEVKKKYVDARTGRAVDATLRVYEQGMEQRVAGVIGFIAGMAVIAAGALMLAVLI